MPNPRPTSTPRPHQWLLMGVQACRLPALKPLKPLKGIKQPLKLCKSFSERPTGQAKATPRPHRSLLMGVQARRYTLETLPTLQHSLGMPNPAATKHPKATSMASYGRPSLPFVSHETLKTPTRLKTLKTLKTVQKLLGTPNRAGKSYSNTTSIASSGRSSLPFARRYTL